MTDKEIIKALECCVDEDCDNCPNRSGIFCIVKIESYALDLIKRQQEQLEAAANGQETLQKALAEKDRIIKRLNDEKIQLIKTFGECQEEAVKDFAKAVIDGLSDGRISRGFDMVDFTADYLRGKMVGDTE